MKLVPSLSKRNSKSGGHMKLIYVCSPYRGDVKHNTNNARRYCRFVCSQGAVPIAVHLHHTQFLDDDIPEERQLGLLLGLHVLRRCNELWVFGDRVSEGMEAEIKTAHQIGIPIYYYSDQCEKRSNSK